MRGTGYRGAYGDHVGRNVSNTASPACRGLVQNIVHPKALVLSGKGVEVLLEKNVLGGYVGEDEVDLGSVACSASADDGPDDLQHGGNAGSAGNHAKVTHHIGSIDESTLGTTHPDCLTDGERGHVLADVAGGVRLDEEVEVAGLVVA